MARGVLLPLGRVSRQSVEVGTLYFLLSGARDVQSFSFRKP